MNIKKLDCVHASEIEAKFGFTPLDYSFTVDFEGDKFIALRLDETYLENTKRTQVCLAEKGPKYFPYTQQAIANDIALIEYFRGLGYTDKILVEFDI